MPDLIVDEAFYMEDEVSSQLICISSNKQKLLVFNINSLSVTYICNINLVKYIS